jgi:hypothetical protein
MFEEIKKEIRKDPEFNQNMELLFTKKLSERIPNRNLQILETLKTDPNTHVYELINDYIESSTGSKVGLEDMQKYIIAHMYDQNGEEGSLVEIGTDIKDPTVEHVTEDTYIALKDICTDYDILKADIGIQLNNKAI